MCTRRLKAKIPSSDMLLGAADVVWTAVDIPSPISPWAKTPKMILISTIIVQHYRWQSGNNQRFDAYTDIFLNEYTKGEMCDK